MLSEASLVWTIPWCRLLNLYRLLCVKVSINPYTFWRVYLSNSDFIIHIQTYIILILGYTYSYTNTERYHKFSSPTYKKKKKIPNFILNPLTLVHLWKTLHKEYLQKSVFFYWHLMSLSPALALSRRWLYPPFTENNPPHHMNLTQSGWGLTNHRPTGVLLFISRAPHGAGPGVHYWLAANATAITIVYRPNHPVCSLYVPLQTLILWSSKFEVLCGDEAFTR